MRYVIFHDCDILFYYTFFTLFRYAILESQHNLGGFFSFLLLVVFDNDNHYLHMGNTKLWQLAFASFQHLAAVYLEGNIVGI